MEHKSGLKEKRKTNGDIIYQMKNGSVVRIDKRGNRVVKVKDGTILQETHDKNFLCQASPTNRPQFGHFQVHHGFNSALCIRSFFSVDARRAAVAKPGGRCVPASLGTV